jgi:LmbE family N-acetylglucosaminyl deacetylase
MMNDDLWGALQRVNDRMAQLLKNAQGAQRGERDFTPEDIQEVRYTMDAMAPIVEQSSELRRRQPELGVPLDVYKTHLNELQDTLEQIRVTLLVKQASLRASQSQLQAVAQWATTFSQTR